VGLLRFGLLGINFPWADRVKKQSKKRRPVVADRFSPVRCVDVGVRGAGSEGRRRATPEGNQTRRPGDAMISSPIISSV